MLVSTSAEFIALQYGTTYIPHTLYSELEYKAT
jgi:hypothetical protein